MTNLHQEIYKNVALFLPIHIPIENHPILPKFSAFYDIFLTIHPIFGICAPL